MEIRKQIQIKLSNMFEASENLNDSEDMNRACEDIKENSKISAKDTIRPWFDKECSQFLGQRKQSKMQWLQFINQSILDNLNSARREASRQFRNRKI
jgi:hypothetical protein